jgi:predicted membrane metal-binding protein
MILIPIMIPVFMGLVLMTVVVAALAVVCFSTLATAALTTGSSLVGTYRRKKTEVRVPAMAAVTVLPGTGVADDWPKAA